MGVTISGQAVVFGFCFLGGAAIGLLFDVLRIVRRETKAGHVLTNALDILFWILATVLSLLWLYTVNDGELRWFEFAAFIAGAGLYFVLISPILLKLVLFLIGIIKRVLLIILKLVMFPVRIVYRLLKKTCIIICVPIGKVSHRACGFFKIRLEMIKKSLQSFKKRVKKV